MRSLLYELRLLQKRKVMILFLLIVIIAVLIGAYYIPPINKDTNPLEFPLMMTKEDVIRVYTSEYYKLHRFVGINEVDVNVQRVRMLDYFIKHDITQYELFINSEMLYFREGDTVVSSAFTVLEAGKYLAIFIAVIMTIYFHTYPLEKGFTRSMVLSECKRRDMFLSKNVLSIAFIVLFALCIDAFARFKISSYSDYTVLVAYKETYIELGIKQMVSARVLGVIITGIFALSCCEFIAFLARRTTLTIAFSIVSIVLCVAIAIAIYPFIGNYEDLSSPGYQATLCLPLVSILNAPTYGYLKESVFVMAGYAVGSIGLFGVDYLLFRKMRA